MDLWHEVKCEFNDQEKNPDDQEDGDDNCQKEDEFKNILDWFVAHRFYPGTDHEWSARIILLIINFVAETEIDNLFFGKIIFQFLIF